MTTSPRLRWEAVAHAAVNRIRCPGRPPQPGAPAHTSRSKNNAARAGATSLLTRAGRRDYPRAAVPEWAGDGDVHRLYLFGEPDEIIPEADASLGTDIAALRSGHISVTPLSFAVELGDLSPGLQSFIARLTQTFPLGNAMGKAQAEA
jgi:hypothetical protein